MTARIEDVSVSAKRDQWWVIILLPISQVLYRFVLYGTHWSLCCSRLFLASSTIGWARFSRYKVETFRLSDDSCCPEGKELETSMKVPNRDGFFVQELKSSAIQ